MMKILRIAVSVLFVLTFAVFSYFYINVKIHTDNTIPVISVDGEMLEVGFKVTDEELLAGVSAFDEKDRDITDKVIVESISKFTEKGVSKVTYAVCDSDNHVAKATRKIRYKDYTSPKFYMQDDICYSLYESIDISNAIGARDCIDGNISRNMIITSDDYVPSAAGVFSINATVTNSKGDTSTITLPLIVEDRSISAPRIVLTDYLVYIEKGQAIDPQKYIEQVVDAEENVLNLEVRAESAVDVNKEGVYMVHYFATDAEGSRGHSVLIVAVGK